MEKICLDFETALDLLRGDLAVVEKLRNYSSSEEICLTSIAMTQLMVSVTKTDAIKSFLNSVTILPFDRNAAHIAANLTIELDGAGGDQKRFDTIMTAAICISNKARLFSRAPALTGSKYDGIKALKKV
jgi:predicted nucleic acid-binding protein